MWQLTDDDFEAHVWRDLVDAETLEIYRAYQRELFIGKRPALLAIDLYNLAYAGGPRPVAEVVREHPSSCGLAAWKAIAPTKRLFEVARAHGLPIFYTVTETRPEANSATATRRQAGQGTAADFEIFPEFAAQPGDVVIYKQRASAFFGTPLAAHLVGRGVDSLVVCGESTSGCVRASVVDGYSHGFHVVVAEECVFDRSELSHKVNLFDLHHKYADVMHLEGLLERLGG